MDKTSVVRLSPEKDAAENLTRVIYSSYRQCYSKDTADNLMAPEGKDLHSISKFICGCIDKGHVSPLEHVSVTFVIKGVSRTMTHQLVRHRIASYSQQSQRYNKYSAEEQDTIDKFMVIPESVLPFITGNKAAIEAVANIFALYLWLTEDHGVPAEDARFFLPEGCRTNIVVTMNLRSWLHFCEERLCKSAQWEIRNVATLIAEELAVLFPWLKNYIGPKCIHADHCLDGKNAGQLCEEHYAWRFED